MIWDNFKGKKKKKGDRRWETVSFDEISWRQRARNMQEARRYWRNNWSESFRMSLLAIVMGGSWLTFVLSMCLTTIVMILLVRRGKFLYALRKVPYPSAFPIIGNAHQLCCSPEGKRNIFSKGKDISMRGELEISEFLFVSNLKNQNNTLKYTDALLHFYI